MPKQKVSRLAFYPTCVCVAALLAIVWGSACAWAAEKPAASKFEPVDVFVSGREGFHTFRIPSLLRGASGALIAIAEARENRGDQARNQLVFKKSTDEGKRWSSIRFLARSVKGSLNNPCAVIVRETGEWIVFYQEYPPGIAERSPELQPGWEGDRIVRTFVVRSRDEGTLWSAPEDVTRQVKQARVATTMSSGPGIGIQLKRGRHAGRLVIPFNEGPYELWGVYAAFSDDLGKTWRQSQRVPGGRSVRAGGKEQSTINEAQVVELATGELMLNMRSWGSPSLRKTSVSKDGGETWSAVAVAPDLVEPSCQAAIVSLDRTSGSDALMLGYSGPIGPARREGWLMISRDQGGSWKKEVSIDPGRFAYSVLSEIGPGKVACLYETGEKDPYEKIRFTILDVPGR